ncbi:MAG: EAL domain-containing protein [Pleomorphochaeta sp.]
MNLKFIRGNTISKSAFKILLLMLTCFVINFLVFVVNDEFGSLQLLSLIPMLIGAFFLNIFGSVLIAIILSVLYSPFLYFSNLYTTNFEIAGWVIRVIGYLVIGFLLGLSLKELKKYHKKLLDDKLRSQFSNFYNLLKLMPDLDALNEKKEKYILVFFNLVNNDELRKYIEFDNLRNFIIDEFTKIQNIFNDAQAYSYSFNQYVFLIKDKDMDEKKCYNLLLPIIKSSSKSCIVGNYSINFLLKAGIVSSSINFTTSKDLIQKARIISEQGNPQEVGIYLYKQDYIEERKLYYEIATSLIDALINNDLYIMYQPIIDLKSRKIDSAEALLRWDRKDKSPIAPGLFITVAEETGLILEITKWLITNVIDNYFNFRDHSIDIVQTINISAVELVDFKFSKWVKNIIEEKQVSPSNFNIEITERVISSNSAVLKHTLDLLKKTGCKIEIDDFGTGYNSFKTLGELPTDIIKLDKYFIHRINEKQIHTMIKCLIELIHKIGGVVIAEGVETKEQFKILENLGCDKIQGFYFSKPLEIKDFYSYYNDFDFYKYE